VTSVLCEIDKDPHFILSGVTISKNRAIKQSPQDSHIYSIWRFTYYDTLLSSSIKPQDYRILSTFPEVYLFITYIIVPFANIMFICCR